MSGDDPESSCNKDSFFGASCKFDYDFIASFALAQYLPKNHAPSINPNLEPRLQSTSMIPMVGHIGVYGNNAESNGKQMEHEMEIGTM